MVTFPESNSGSPLLIGNVSWSMGLVVFDLSNRGGFLGVGLALNVYLSVAILLVNLFRSLYFINMDQSRTVKPISCQPFIKKVRKTLIPIVCLYGSLRKTWSSQGP